MNNSQQVTCDPAMISAFLNESLSPQQESPFMVHLESCERCRSRLRDEAAEDAIWGEFEAAMRDQPGDLVILSSVSERPRDCSPPVEVQVEQVIGMLNPTDDPAMLGRIGGYEVAGVIGSGGMGVVLKAHDPSLDRIVAIKVLAPHLASSGSARKRFARESKAAAAVLHPNVVAIHSVSNEDKLPYLVMPYLRGQSLQKRIDSEGPLLLPDILRIAAQIAAGLSAAHQQGLVHRDIKPANILLEDGVERVAITDFGLARAVDDASMTRTGVIAGTPQFMSPEQARGETLDARSDLFSLGSVLYTMCTGRPPFRAETSYGILRRITDAEPRPIREINPDIPEWLCAIIARLMSKQAEDRFASAAEVAELLEECLAHVQQPATASLPAGVQFLGDRAPKTTKSAFAGWTPARLLAIATFALALLFAGILIVLELNKGTLTIESDADNVPIRITQGDDVVDELTVSKSGASVRVAAGRYVVKIEGDLDGITIENGTVVLKRRGKGLVRIVRTSDADGVASTHAATLVTRVYPVSDLVIPDPKPGAENVADNAWRTEFALLVESIMRDVAPRSWDKAGGPASIQDVPTNLSLRILQTEQAHEQIEKLIFERRQLARETREPHRTSGGSKLPAADRADQGQRNSLCMAPFSHLVRQTSWSDSRYLAFLLSQAEFDASVNIDVSLSRRLSSVYSVAEDQSRLTKGKRGEPIVAWEDILKEMQALLTDAQLRRARQLYWQQVGLGIFTSDDPAIRTALGLTGEQRRNIVELMGAYERGTARINYHFADVKTPKIGVTRPDLFAGAKAAAVKPSWLQYWLDRQIDEEIIAELTLDQRKKLLELRGDPVVSIQPPDERFGRDVIQQLVETMAPGSYRANLIHLRPPAKDDVVTQWLAAQHFEKEKEPPRDALHVVTEKLVDYVMDSVPSDKMHPGQWHVAIYCCTVFRNGVVEPVGVIFRDVARFYPTEKQKTPGTADTSRSLDHRSLVYAVKQFNAMTADVRGKLFEPPIADLTMDRLREGFRQSAELYRRSGKRQVADALQRIAETDQLPDEATAGLFGSGVEARDDNGELVSRQVVPALFLPDSTTASGVSLVPLRPLELMYRKDGPVSKDYGDQFVMPYETEKVPGTIDAAAAYRAFLWDTLGPLRPQRTHLLSAIADFEQQLVDLDLRQPVEEVPEDADAETKERLLSEKKRTSALADHLAAKIEDLRAELVSVEQQIALLTKKLEQAPPTSGAKDQVAFDAEIVSVADGHVEIAAGAGDGVQRGMRLPVFRDQDLAGEIEVVKVEAKKSLARVIKENSRPPIRAGDRATMLLDARAAEIIGSDRGESIYNDRLKRFKFHLEKIQVGSSAETGEWFWRLYQGQGHPPIAGVWGDPRTNSLVVVGPPEAEQAIRDTIARWEGSTTGIELEDDSLESQRRRLQNRRRAALRQIASHKLEIIDAETAGEKPDGERLTELNRKLNDDTLELESIDRKLKALNEIIREEKLPAANVEQDGEKVPALVE